MPLYEFQCKKCGDYPVEVFVPLVDFDKPTPQCEYCGTHKERLISAPRVMSDIEPYRAVAADRETGERPMITSRSQHREFLNRNGYFEIGNEKPKSIATAPDKQEIGRQIKQTMDQKGIRA